MAYLRISGIRGNLTYIYVQEMLYLDQSLWAVTTSFFRIHQNKKKLEHLLVPFPPNFDWYFSASDDFFVIIMWNYKLCSFGRQGVILEKKVTSKTPTKIWFYLFKKTLSYNSSVGLTTVLKAINPQNSQRWTSGILILHGTPRLS